jgi:hypothetical protein
MKLRIALCAVAVGLIAAATVSTPSAHAASTRPAPSGGRQGLAKLAANLDKSLGKRSAGSFLDQSTGKLVVTVTDGSAAQSVRAAGAIPRMVARSRADLEKATDELSRTARIAGTAWAVDPTTNQVVISVDESVKGASLTKIKSAAEKLGAAARIEQVKGTFTTLSAPFMRDGSPIYTGAGQCSLGFNVFTIGGGPQSHYFLTAGHCTHLGSTWYSNENLDHFLGSNSGDSGVFGIGGDYGIVHYEADGIHVFGSVFDTNQTITGADDPFVGQSVTRSGSTSGVHSGFVTALNATVNYHDGATVAGMIKTNVCAEPGDSGGPLYSGSTGLGLTSGGNGDCSIGGTTFFQPVAPIMRDFALQMWR